MKCSFGQFIKRPHPQHRYGDLSAADRAIISAFNKGQEAGRSDGLRRPPYQPSQDADKIEAWLCGYDDVSPRYSPKETMRYYVAVSGTERGK